MQAKYLIVRSQFIKRSAAKGFRFPAKGKDFLNAGTTARADPTESHSTPTSATDSRRRDLYRELLLNERVQSVGLIPVTRRNSRLKFDFVLKPEDSIASITEPPAERYVCAVEIRALLT